MTNTKLLDFQKRDGQWSEIFGVKAYSMAFEAVAENFPSFESGYRGKKVVVAGVIDFSKSEKGWKGTIRQVKVIRLASHSLMSNPEATQSGAAVQSVPKPVRTPNEICLHNLNQIGQSFSTWSLDHFNQFPFNLPIVDGGSKESYMPGPDGFDLNAQAHFACMSNELSTPKLLVCPADKSRTPELQDWTLERQRITYKLRSGPDVSDSHPEQVLVWCPMHGHLVLCDGKILTNTSGNARVLLEKYLTSKPANTEALSEN